MSTSTLTPDNLPVAPDRSVLKGHDTTTLGPGDSSDSGSDVIGAEGEDETQAEALGVIDRGTEGADIAPDHIEKIPDADPDEDEVEPA